MGDDHLEHPRVGVPPEQLDRAARHTQMADDAVGLHLAHGFDRPTGRCRLREGNPLGVVQVDQRQVVQAQPFPALPHRGVHPPAGEVSGRVRIHLGRHQKPFGHAAEFAQDGADQAFAGAVLTVLVRGIDEGDRPLEHPAQRFQRPVFGHHVPVRLRHAADRTGAHAQLGHLQPGFAERPDLHVFSRCHRCLSFSVERTRTSHAPRSSAVPAGTGLPTGTSARSTGALTLVG